MAARLVPHSVRLLLRRPAAAAAAPRSPVSPAAVAAVSHSTRGHSHSHGSCGGHHHHHGAVDLNLDQSDLRKCQRATLVGAFTNLFFSTSKLWFGSCGGSIALMADGFHTLTDLFADAVSYTFLTASRRRLPRCRFPFGIGRLETLGTVMVACILLSGSAFLLWESVWCCWAEGRKLLSLGSTGDGVENVVASAISGGGGHGHAHGGHSHGHGGHSHGHFTLTEVDPSTGTTSILWAMIGLAATSIVCKELLFQWTYRIGKRAGSRVVVANAFHHRADAWSGAVALVGVGGQFVGIPGIDGVAGLVVSGVMCRMGWQLSCEAVMEFFDYQRLSEVQLVRHALQDVHAKLQQEEQALGGVATEGGPIELINIYLLRHGHFYAVHVTLLTSAELSAQRMSDVVRLTTERANASLVASESPLRIGETFISLLVCTNEAVERSTYIHQHAHRSGNDNSSAKESNSISAMEGSSVNPSLERCVASLMAFHHFVQPIRYHWEERRLLLVHNHPHHQHCHHQHGSASACCHPHDSKGSSSSSAAETAKEVTEGNCMRDLRRVALMFNCDVVDVPSPS